MQAFEQSGDKAGVALLFPGQGTQHIGMGEAVCDQSPATARVWDCASDIAGFDLRRLCSKGPMPRLDKTQYQQVAVTCVNIASLVALRERGEPDVAALAGHSVGEFSALFAAGVLFGTAGIKVLSSKDAKKVYTHTTAAVLRDRKSVV